MTGQVSRPVRLNNPTVAYFSQPRKRKKLRANDFRRPTEREALGLNELVIGRDEATLERRGKSLITSHVRPSCPSAIGKADAICSARAKRYRVWVHRLTPQEDTESTKTP